MPISSIDGCSEQHWSEVKAILVEALERIGFNASLVSDADDVGIIQKRIIQNLYENPIVVCDVSGKNPNVMFELGMRLAFDKPTIIIKDDKTSYSFDTSPIEHLEYPRDLRFARIVDFQRSLGQKVKATFESSANPNYTTFLKNFGTFSVAKIDQKEVSKDEYLLQEIQEIKRLVSRRNVASVAYDDVLRHAISRDVRQAVSRLDSTKPVSVQVVTAEILREILAQHGYPPSMDPDSFEAFVQDIITDNLRQRRPIS